MVMSIEPLFLETLPGSEIAGIAALAGVVVVASFALNYQMLKFLISRMAAESAEREVREKEAEAMRAAATLAAEILRDRRAG